MLSKEYIMPTSSITETFVINEESVARKFFKALEDSSNGPDPRSIVTFNELKDPDEIATFLNEGE